MTHTQEPSRFELFSANAKSNISAYREELKGDGSFAYVSQVIELDRLSRSMNLSMLVYLFGEQTGSHLMERFAVKFERNLLTFLSNITSEYRFFILHELKNNESLFAYA